MAQLPSDYITNPRIPCQPFALNIFLGLPGVPHKVDKAVSDIVASANAFKLNLNYILLEKNNTLTHHWNGGLNICQVWETSVKGTYSKAQCGVSSRCKFNFSEPHICSPS